MKPGRLLFAGSIVALALGACGGGGGGDDAGNVFDAIGDAANGGDSSDPGNENPSAPGGVGAGEVGAVTLDADPLHGWVEVDGERLEYVVHESIGYTCTLGDENVRINFQTGEGGGLTINGIKQENGWNLSLNMTGEGNIGYGAASMTSQGVVGLEGGAMSFEGELDRIEDFDFDTIKSVPASMALNCNPPGPDPSAEIDGTTYSAAFNDASSIRCLVEENEVLIDVSRQAPERITIQVNADFDGSIWLGNASIRTTDGDYLSTMPTDGTGLTIDGSSVTYSGTFEGSGSEVPGVVAVVCP